MHENGYQNNEKMGPMLTCARIVIDFDVPSLTNAHKRSRSINTHSVFPAVVTSFSTLINIYMGTRTEIGLVLQLLYGHNVDTLLCINEPF